MNDRYTCYQQCLQRLKLEKEKYQTLYIAFDFDNTVFDYHQVGDEFPKLEQLLKACKLQGFKLILFTANEGQKLKEAITYCTKKGYAPDYINENPLMKTRKPYYNLLLDDRAGLGETSRLLEDLLTNISTNDEN